MSLANWEQGAEETLADLPSYKLPQSKAGSIVGRRFTSWFPAGSATSSSSGTRSLRFQLSGDQGLLLPDTVQLRCQLNNTDANAAITLASENGLMSGFVRCRIYCGGALVEDPEEPFGDRDDKDRASEAQERYRAPFF